MFDKCNETTLQYAMVVHHCYEERGMCCNILLITLLYTILAGFIQQLTFGTETRYGTSASNVGGGGAFSVCVVKTPGEDEFAPVTLHTPSYLLLEFTMLAKRLFFIKTSGDSTD